VVSAITATADGGVWFTEAGGKIGRSTSTGALQEFTLAPGARPTDIATGSDGNVWIADNGRDSIDRLTPAGTIVEYHLPPGDAPPLKLTADHDGIWFIESGRAVLGRMSLSGQFSDVSLGGFIPSNIAVDSNNDVWLSEVSRPRIARYSSGDLSIVSLEGVASLWGPVRQMALAGDGSLWFTQAAGGNYLGHITTGYAVSYIQLASGETAFAVETDSAGNVWFSASGGVGTVNLATSVVVQYPMQVGVNQPFAIGSDGSLWLAATGDIIRLRRDLFSLTIATQYVGPQSAVLLIATFTVNPSSAQPSSGLGQITVAVSVGMEYAVSAYVPESANAVPLVVSFASTIVVKSAVSRAEVVNFSSLPGASGADKPPDLYFYDSTVRVSWQSLTLHPEANQVSFVIMTGITSGALTSERFSSLPATRSSGFAGKPTDTNTESMTTESTDTVAVDSSAGGPQPDLSKAGDGPSAETAGKRSSSKQLALVRLPFHQANFTRTSVREPLAQGSNIERSTRTSVVRATSLGTGPLLRHGVQVDDLLANCLLPYPGGVEPTPASSGSAVPPPADRELIRVADEVLARAGHQQERAKIPAPSLFGSISRLVVTVLLFQPVFRAIAWDNRLRDSERDGK
jgi:streptogramin lyase